MPSGIPSGYIEFHLGNLARAAAHFESALSLCRYQDNRLTEAGILTRTGDVHHAVGELPQARQAWQPALIIYDDIHHPEAGNVRAKLDQHRGRPSMTRKSGQCRNRYGRGHTARP
jgi:tetratricopeptide (TPR) repeat protein